MSFISSVGKALGIPFGYGVYVHWPYCSQLCSYCNFNKYLEPHETEEYWIKFEDCLVTELRSLLELLGYPKVSSVYFGGGTPSLASPGTIKRLLDCIKIEDNVEVTLEVNPHPTVRHKLSSFQDAGVNRLSLGIQSLNDDTLSLIRRDHSSREALDTLRSACSLMPPGRVNVDLMFGLPGQTMKDWVDHLTHIITNYPIGHMSLYQLTLESGTPLMKAVKSGNTSLPNPSIVSDMYFIARELLEVKGLLHQYEVSNYALKGSQSNHNLNYWLGGNYIGVGPGAHSRYQSSHSYDWISSINALTPQQWMKTVNGKGCGTKAIKKISPKERFEEILVTSLRTEYGLLSEHCELLNIDYNQLLELFKECSPELFASGLLQSSNTGITATINGVAVLDAVVTDLLTHSDNFRYK